MELIIYYLEMVSPSLLKGKPKIADFVVKEVEIPQFEFNKYLYILVGKSWHWNDKLSWTDSDWKNHVQNKNLKTYVAYYKGTPVGYYELLQETNGSVQIVLFGLASGFIGKGFGGYFLTQALQSAWELNNTKRVYLNTCSLDHPSALKNYKARGMTVYKTITNPK